MQTIYVDTPEEVATHVCRLVIDHGYSWWPTEKGFSLSVELQDRFLKVWNGMPYKVQHSYALGKNNPFTIWDGVVGHVYLTSKKENRAPVLVCLKGAS